MGIEIVIAFIILLVGIIGTIVWIKKSIVTKFYEEKSSLESEINQKNEELVKLPFLQQNVENLTMKIDDLTKKIESLEKKNSDLEALNRELSYEKATFEANAQAQQQTNERLQEEFKQQSQKLELKLNEIMQKSLETSLEGKLKKFDETSMKSLDNLLKPFKENIDTFRKKVEESQESSIKKFAELSKEIEHVTKAGIDISKEAQNLSNALQSKKQMQGSWGEMILESVLESSGLIKGEHYETQASYKDESGNTKRPDVVVKLPQNRTIIIDSKVSLNDYNSYIQATDEAQQQIAAKKVVQAFKDQIDNLDSKDYAHYKVGTLQYVFMFVPIEGAFALAVQSDPSLYEYALKKHIAIVNPSTLTVSLHTIYLYWQSEQSTTLATKLFDEAGKLYDKVYNFSETFSKVGTQLQTANRSYETALKQLSEGNGNILGRVENLKKLGARSSKTLKSQKIEFQELNLDDAEIEFVEDEPKLIPKEE